MSDDLETDLVRHYQSAGDGAALLDRIKEALRLAGADPDRPRRDDLKPADEFHMGGLPATDALLAQLSLGIGDRVLDIGSGIGGSARHVAATTGAEVTGVDLVPAYVEVATALSAAVGETRTRFVPGTANRLPAEDGAFDAALMIHVGMNVPDKPALFAEAHRALRPGGTFAVYDAMRTGEGGIAFPVPWAAGPEQSHLATPGTYREAADAAGFLLTAERDRGDFARDFFAQAAARAAEHGPPPISIAVLMGETARDKIANLRAALDARAISPVEMIFRKPG